MIFAATRWTIHYEANLRWRCFRQPKQWLWHCWFLCNFGVADQFADQKQCWLGIKWHGTSHRQVYSKVTIFCFSFSLRSSFGYYLQILLSLLSEATVKFSLRWMSAQSWAWALHTPINWFTNDSAVSKIHKFQNIGAWKNCRTSNCEGFYLWDCNFCSRLRSNIWISEFLSLFPFNFEGLFIFDPTYYHFYI